MRNTDLLSNRLSRCFEVTLFRASRKHVPEAPFPTILEAFSATAGRAKGTPSTRHPVLQVRLVRVQLARPPPATSQNLPRAPARASSPSIPTQFCSARPRSLPEKGGCRLRHGASGAFTDDRDRSGSLHRAMPDRSHSGVCRWPSRAPRPSTLATARRLDRLRRARLPPLLPGPPIEPCHASFRPAPRRIDLRRECDSFREHPILR